MGFDEGNLKWRLGKEKWEKDHSCKKAAGEWNNNKDHLSISLSLVFLADTSFFIFDWLLEWSSNQWNSYLENQQKRFVFDFFLSWSGYHGQADSLRVIITTL